METISAATEKRGWRQVAALWLLLWHLCSLDAPTVAVVWAVMLARVAGARLQMAELVVLACGTWIVYVLDRVLDGMGGRPNGAGRVDLRERHHFHRAHRTVLLRLCWVAAGVVAVLCCWLPLRLVEVYLVLAVPVALYGVGVHRRLLWGTRPPSAHLGMSKEAAVAVLFTAAVAAPALVGMRSDGGGALLLGAVLLGGLCWLNCLLISYAESGGLSEGQGWRLDSVISLRLERQRLGAGMLALACAATAACGWSLGWKADARGLPVSGAVLLSCLVLLALLVSSRGGALSARRLRVLADLGLLTPLLFLIVPG